MAYIINTDHKRNKVCNEYKYILCDWIDNVDDAARYFTAIHVYLLSTRNGYYGKHLGFTINVYVNIDKDINGQQSHRMVSSGSPCNKTGCMDRDDILYIHKNCMSELLNRNNVEMLDNHIIRRLIDGNMLMS